MLRVVAAAGAGLIALFVALTLFGVWSSDSDDNSPADNSTPTPTHAVTETPSPTITPSPAASGQEPPFRLAAWDGERWQFEGRLEGAKYREGEAIPLLLRIDRARIGDVYPLTITYDCEAFDLLTDYERDYGSESALASPGPGSATPDSTLLIPDDRGTRASSTETGYLSLWGGSFGAVDIPAARSPCAGEESLSVELAAAADALHLIWGAEISPGAAARDAPLRLTVQAAGAEELTVEIDPDSLRPVQP
jgi:hypothetical protein